MTASSGKQAVEADDFYVDDVDFNSGFVHRLSPHVMEFVARFRGVHYESPGFEGTAYCELACGDGSTTNVLAGLFPDMEFVGVDFNRKHIDDAASAAEAKGLRNVRYVCCSFDELHQHDMPKFQFIGINGAYGWLTPALRGAVREFVQGHLADGGLFAVEYLSAPGKSAIQTLWKMVQRLHPVEDYENSQARGVAGIKFLNGLNAANPQVFKAHPSIRGAVRRYLGRAKNNPGSVDHFVHNALAGGFEARYFNEVYDEMFEVGLTYAGRIDNFAQNDESFSTGPARFRLINQYESPRERELIKDYLMNTGGRCDLYIKDADQAPVDTTEAAFAPYYALSRVSYEDMNEKPYRQLFSSDDIKTLVALDGTKTLGEVFEEQAPSRTLLSLLNRLMDTGEVLLSTQQWLETDVGADRYEIVSEVTSDHLNRQLARGLGGNIPTPGLVTGLKIGPVELGLLLMMVEYGRKAALGRLEARVGAQTETLPSPFNTSVMRRKTPAKLLDQAQEFFGGDTINALVKSRVLQPVD